MTTFYFGLRSPSCRSLCGQRIGGTRLSLDAHGCNVTTAALPGDGWRIQHDVLKWTITEDMRHAQVRSSTEVYDLFVACIPQHERHHLNGLPARQRQGLLPDFMLQENDGVVGQPRLLEPETMHSIIFTYSAVTQSCVSVNRRADCRHAE